MNSISKRIFIIPVGYNAFRAEQKPTNPDYIYLITQHHDPNSGMFDKYRDVVLEITDYFAFGDVTVFGVDDFFNLFELMSVYRYICDLHKDDEIFINVGCGSKLTAMAGFMVSGWYDNVTCFYPKMLITTERVGIHEYRENEIESIQIINAFPVKKIEKHLVPVLNYLKDGMKSKKEILNMLQELDVISNYFEVEDGTLKERSPQSLYNILKRNYLSPLEEEDYIRELKTGEMSLTQRGEDIQLIFGKSKFNTEKLS